MYLSHTALNFIGSSLLRSVSLNRLVLADLGALLVLVLLVVLLQFLGNICQRHVDVHCESAMVTLGYVVEGVAPY